MRIVRQYNDYTITCWEPINCIVITSVGGKHDFHPPPSLSWFPSEHDFYWCKSYCRYQQCVNPVYLLLLPGREEAKLPMFSDNVSNLTVVAGREAVLSCHVNHLGSIFENGKFDCQWPAVSHLKLELWGIFSWRILNKIKFCVSGDCFTPPGLSRAKDEFGTIFRVSHGPFLNKLP